MYSRWMNNLLFYFDLSGFCTEFRKSLNQRVFDSLIFLLHIILVSIFSVSILAYLTRLSADKLGTLNDTLKLYGILVVYWLSIFESFIQRPSQRKFWFTVDKIDKRFCSHRYVCFKSYICKFILCYVISILMHLNYVYRLFVVKHSELYFFWLCYTALVLFYTNRLFYYLFYLEFIKYELKVIDQEISLILISYRNVHNVVPSLKKFHQNRFKWTRNYFESIYDLCSTTNSIFSWANVGNVLLPFLIFLADTNWFYWKIYNKYPVDIYGKIFDERKNTENINESETKTFDAKIKTFSFQNMFFYLSA